jgi:sporulation protein YlmC with PRC-barrel domain
MSKCAQQLGSTVLVLAFLASVALGQSQPKRETTVTKEISKNGATVSRTWHKSTEVVGRPITTNGQNIGKVEDLVVDVNSGRVIYGIGTMSTGGDKLYPIPWPAGRYSIQTRTYELPAETVRLESVPTFTPKEVPNFADPEFATRTYTSYNQTPYWKTEKTVVRTSDRPTTTYTERWTQPPTTVHRITELRGRTIRTPEGTTLGQIDEVVLDPENGRILYAVTTRNGTSVPIPWSALRASNNDFELSITADRWKAAPVIETERWTNLAEPQWSQQVYRYYEVAPDWDDDDDDDGD